MLLIATPADTSRTSESVTWAMTSTLLTHRRDIPAEAPCNAPSLRALLSILTREDRHAGRQAEDQTRQQRKQDRSTGHSHVNNWNLNT